MHLHAQQFCGVLKMFSCTSSFFGEKCKPQHFDDKCFFSKMFYRIKMQAATNWSNHLKNIKHLNFFKRQIFYAIFKNRVFPRFLKIISSPRNNHCMRLILCQHGRQIPTKTRLVHSTTENMSDSFTFRFQSKILRINFTPFINDFFNFFSRTVTSCINKKSLKISLPYSR